jgi:hypothetical protein
MTKGTPEVETLQVPHEYMAFADRRIDAIVRRACHDANIVESVARSCYLQGLWDGVQLAHSHPDLLQELSR